jgi:predicted secreted protein
MAGTNGADWLLQIRVSTGPDTYATLGSQRGGSVERTAAEIDMSNKDSPHWQGVAGRRSSSISLEKLYVSNASDQATLKAAWAAGTLLRVRTVALGAEAGEQADCIITNITNEFPDQDASVQTVDLRVTGTWGAFV